MHLFIFNHQSSRSSDRLYLLILLLRVRPYSGLVGKATYPPVKFIPSLWRGWLLPVVVYFYNVYLNTLDIFFWASQPWLIWIIVQGICSDLEGYFLFWCLWHYWRKLKSGQWFFSIASARAGVSVLSNIFRDVCSCRQFLVSYRLYGGAYFWGILIVPKFSLILRVFHGSHKDWSVTVRDVPGILLPDFCCSRLETKQVSAGCIPSLWRYF